MRTTLRPARPEDFGYCARLYVEAMEKIIKQTNLNMDAQAAGFRRQWEVTQVRIITLDGTQSGWLQSFVKEDALFLGQLFVEAALRGRGIGTEVVKALIEEAARAGRGMTLGVVKTNPALRLYERLGFRVTHDDERKFYMRRDLNLPRLFRARCPVTIAPASRNRRSATIDTANAWRGLSGLCICGSGIDDASDTPASRPPASSGVGRRNHRPIREYPAAS